MSETVDLTAMYAVHDALRRELRHLERIVTRTGTDVRAVLATAAGWQLLKKALHAHHRAEDEALWPVLRRAAAGRPEDQSLLEAMEAEHAAIDPLVETIDALLADPDADPAQLGDLVQSLVTGLAGHLKHEEDATLPLVAREITAEQWAEFGRAHAQRIGPDAPFLLPWLLDGATDEVTATLLASLPDAARAACTTQWQPAYAQLNRWNPGTAH